MFFRLSISGNHFSCAARGGDLFRSFAAELVRPHRELLRDVAAGRLPTGDTTTLEDLSVLATLKEEEE